MPFNLPLLHFIFLLYPRGSTGQNQNELYDSKSKAVIVLYNACYFPSALDGKALSLCAMHYWCCLSLINLLAGIMLYMWSDDNRYC